MARRQIGQEVFAFIADPISHRSSLDRLSLLIDWPSVDRRLVDIYAAAKDEPAWPPLTLFRALLLAVWHDPSHVRLAEALEDRASFRRFCGFAAHGPTPERTAFVRFRRELVLRGLDKMLFDEVTHQLRTQSVIIKQCTLIDATVIASATYRDTEAAWAGTSGARRFTASRLISRPMPIRLS
ncbi:transposase [Microvirga sp. BSC39]|uniref:transposase n=1 Tax=Microvirga sp. BSC39 TaxID=1549810 RepID=UPI000A46AC76|nr:transposase [Microvirga sp. BSC39]